MKARYLASTVYKYPFSTHTLRDKRGGAVVACWAHNPEVGGSKPLSAMFFIFSINIFPGGQLHLNTLILNKSSSGRLSDVD